MAAASADRVNYGATPDGKNWAYPITNARLYEGTLIVINAAGHAAMASDTTGTTAVVGYLDAPADGAGTTAGTVEGRVRRGGVAEFETVAGGNAIVQADVGRDCYVVDNQTVAKQAGTTNGVIAGEVMGIRTVNGVTKVIVKCGKA